MPFQPPHNVVPTAPPQETTQALRTQAEYFESALETIKKRIAELEAAQKQEG
jgi:hypothetical protein